MIGLGILKGMAVTARNFVGSYFEKDRLITVQYPEERSPRERFDALLLRKGELSKSNTYYHSICPTEAAEVDAKLAEAAAKKKPAPPPSRAAPTATPPAAA